MVEEKNKELEHHKDVFKSKSYLTLEKVETITKAMGLELTKNYEHIEVPLINSIYQKYRKDYPEAAKVEC